jgi:dipeptidyl aminopeptidase/acylaminoacyl peptidase
MPGFHKTLVVLFVALCAHGAAAQTAARPHTLDDLLRDWDIQDARLSPNGDYLAVTVPIKDNKVILSVFPLARPTEVHTIGVSSSGEMIGSFEWAAPRRLVYTIRKRIGGDRIAPYETGEILAINADGTGYRVLHSWRGEKSQSSFARVIDTLADDDRHVLVATSSVDRGPNGDFTQVWRLNIENGARVRVASAPLRNALFLADRAGEVRVAYGTDSRLAARTYWRVSRGEEWKLIVDGKLDGRWTQPVGIDPTGTGIYVHRESPQGPDGVFRLSLADGAWTPLSQDVSVSPTAYYFTADGGELYGVRYDDGRATVRPVGSSAEARLLAALQKAFPGLLVEIVDFTTDGNYALVEVSGSDNPGDFYLFDRRSKKTDYLASRGQWLDQNQLAPKQPVSLHARDGLVLHGYLTVPRGKDANKLPLVVWIHAGPHDERDASGYQRDVQILAFGGYAVLQVNFRGSAGYGRAFAEAGYRRWGREMQDDVTDATRWAIAQGIADPERICIGGFAYGGYAAMMGVVREPDLYRCAISYAGPHDLRMLYRIGDIEDSEFGRNYLKLVIGEDKSELADASPVTHAAKIRTPVLLLAGNMDRRVPVAHAKDMAAALRKAGKPVELIVKSREGHGFYDPENRREAADAILRFLDRHIGSAGNASAGAPSR